MPLVLFGLPLWDFIRPLFPDTSQNPQYQPAYA